MARGTYGTKTGNAIGRPYDSDDVENQIRLLRAEGLGMLKIAKLAGWLWCICCAASGCEKCMNRSQLWAGSRHR